MSEIVLLEVDREIHIPAYTYTGHVSGKNHKFNALSVRMSTDLVHNGENYFDSLKLVPG